MIPDFTIYIRSLISPKRGNRRIWVIWLKGSLGSFPVGECLTRKDMIRKLEKMKSWLRKKNFTFKVVEKCKNFEI